MPVIAITGAGSFIGTHLLKKLAACGDTRLRLLVHRKKDFPLLEGMHVSVIQGDLRKPETLTGFVETGCTVVHLAYLGRCSPDENIEAAANLAEACRVAGIKRLIHCSTAVVAGRVDTDRVTENTPLNPLREYEIVKAKVENIILEKSAGLYETVILRPTAVLGIGGQSLLKLAGDLLHGNRLLNYLKSCTLQYRRLNLVCIDNVVSALAFLIHTDRKVDREVFLISDDESPINNYHDVENFLMKRLGLKAYPVPVIPLPDLVLKVLLKLTGRTNTNPFLVYDCRKILSLGFKKDLSFEQGLSGFADWYVETFSPGKGMGPS
ncbi:MAG: hypothetical protein A2V65_10585 [Deltaproteobacteria bacterium RBG_13_49_15]|nr:MAG: hypothetical protein A2V65_10585 [Deltaproteobacteria bacterium RBG_13_49_15]